MKKFMLVAVLTTATLMAGCKATTYAINAAAVSTSITELTRQFDQVSESMDANILEFDAVERAQLQTLEGELRNLRRAAQTLLADRGDVGTVLINADQVKTLFTQGKIVYAEAKIIISPKMQNLPPDVQAQLMVFDNSARRLNESLKTLLITPGADITQAVGDLLNLGATAARLTKVAAIL